MTLLRFAFLVSLLVATKAAAQGSPCFAIGQTGDVVAGCGNDGGGDFADGYRSSHPESRCWAATEAAAKLGKAKRFKADVANYYVTNFGVDPDSCESDADFLRKLCGVSLGCWKGGTSGYSLYPLAGLGLATWRIGGGVQSVFNGFGLTSVKVGAGVKTWQSSTKIEEHAYAFFSTSKTSGVTAGTPEDIYRFGIGAGVGLFNGLFTGDLVWIALGDNINAKFLGGGLAVSLNIDLASGALLGLAAISPKGDK